MEDNNKEKGSDYIIHKINLNYTYTVYRDDRNGKVFYRIPITHKSFDGQILKASYQVRFDGGADIPNGSKIKIKKAHENFYLVNSEKGYPIPVMSMQIHEYEIVENALKEFAEATNTIVSDDDLPF